MKALWIIYDIVLDDEMLSLMDEMKIAGFTRWPRISGRGPKSGARLDNYVWPGANSGIMTVQDSAVIARLMSKLQKMRDEVGAKTGIWAFTTNVMETLG